MAEAAKGMHGQGNEREAGARLEGKNMECMLYVEV